MVVFEVARVAVQNLTKERDVELAAGESRLLSVPVQVPIDATRLYWEVSAGTTGAKEAGGKDRLRATQTVMQAHPVRVYQATLAQLDKPLQFPVERPADAVPGRGGVRVEVMKSLAGELTPLFLRLIATAATSLLALPRPTIRDISLLIANR
jgi:hypothetical protein